MYFNERSIFMNHFEVITASKTWTCPKTGIYKIIAVGGGTSSAFLFKNSKSSQHVCISGGNTTFGNKLTALGGINKIPIPGMNDNAVIGGAGGYTLQNYGGEGGYFVSTYCSPPTVNGGAPGMPGHGFGSGAANGSSFSSSITLTINGDRNDMTIRQSFNKPGEINELICDISANESIACSIGNCGVLTTAELSSAIKKIYSFTDSEYTAQTSLVSAVTNIIMCEKAGKSGCIVIEYLGESY